MHCRAVTNVMQKCNYVDGASALNHHFTDSGLFGMTIEGPGSHSAELMKHLQETLNDLKNPIDEVELNRAKNVLKMNILMGMERTEDRLEEIARNYMTFGDLTFHDYCNKIDAVTSDDVNRHATRLLGGKPTMLVTGNGINLVPPVTDVARQLN